MDNELASRKRPGLPVRKKFDPANLLFELSTVTLNIFQLAWRTAPVLLWPLIDPKPYRQPNKTEGSDQEERPAPAPVDRYPRHHEGCDDGASIGSRIEDTSCQRAFFLREPLCDCFQTGGGNSSLPEPHGKPRAQKTSPPTSQPLTHLGTTPPPQHPRVSYRSF